MPWRMAWMSLTLTRRMLKSFANRAGSRLSVAYAIPIFWHQVCLLPYIIVCSTGADKLGVLGSWDGEIRLWKLDSKLKSFSLLGVVPALGVVNSLQFVSIPRSQLARYAWVEERSADSGISAQAVSSDGNKAVILVAGVGQEMRTGRWIQKKGSGVLNGALVVALSIPTSSTS